MRRRCFPILILCALLCTGGAQAWATDLVLHGVISDVNGKPVAGAEVALYTSKNVKKPADFASQRTAADGVYTVPVPAGTYWGVAVLRKGERRFGPLELGDKHSGEAVELNIAADGELEHDFTVMDLREAAKQNQKKSIDLVRLSGRILDHNGQPVAMAYAMADRQERFKEMPHYLSAWSDSSGTYLLFLPKGSFYLGAATDFPPDPALTLGKEINLTSDTEGVDLLLPKK